MATVADEQRLEASPSELDALDRMEGAGTWSVGGQEIRLTNLDKVLFPDGSTKRDLIRYYATAAPLIIPYLRGRAVNLHRYPDGVGSGRGFWQKDLPPRTPKWIPRWRYVHRVEGPTDYCVVDRLATLVRGEATLLPAPLPVSTAEPALLSTPSRRGRRSRAPSIF